MNTRTQRPKPDEFSYVNQYYGLKLKKHSPVEHVSKGTRGQVVKGEGQYIYIQWDGEPKPSGPYHPTDDLKYLEAGS